MDEISLRCGLTKTAKCTGEGPLKQSRRGPKSLYYLEKPACLGATRRISRGRSEPVRWLLAARAQKDLHVEALAAAAFALGFGVLKLECLIQPLLDEIDQGSID